MNYIQRHAKRKYPNLHERLPLDLFTEIINFLGEEEILDLHQEDDTEQDTLYIPPKVYNKLYYSLRYTKYETQLYKLKAV